MPGRWQRYRSVLGLIRSSRLVTIAQNFPVFKIERRHYRVSILYQRIEHAAIPYLKQVGGRLKTARRKLGGHDAVHGALACVQRFRMRAKRPQQPGRGRGRDPHGVLDLAFGQLQQCARHRRRTKPAQHAGRMKACPV